MSPLREMIMGRKEGVRHQFHWSFGFVGHSAILLELNLGQVFLVNDLHEFCESGLKKSDRHIAIKSDRQYFASLFKKIRVNDLRKEFLTALTVSGALAVQDLSFFFIFVSKSNFIKIFHLTFNCFLNWFLNHNKQNIFEDEYINKKELYIIFRL